MNIILSITTSFSYFTSGCKDFFYGLKEIDPNHIGVTLTAITLFVSYVVYVIRVRTQFSQSFQNCIKALYSKNSVEQISAAILLRSFMRMKFYLPSYAKDAINLTVVLLRLPKIPIELQKTLSDGFSFVHDIDGQDMQYTNLMNAIIKPKSAIKYETTENKWYLFRRISMRCVDFYHAVLQMANFNFVNFEGAIFYGCIINDARFYNCICKRANFKYSNLDGVIFDSNCVLEGAKFWGASGLSTAYVIRNKEKRKLIDFLDEAGIFHETPKGSSYKEPNDKKKVFVSKLGVMDSKQQHQYHSIMNILERNDDYEFVMIDRNNYRPTSQLVDVASQMDNCSGCIIFAFEYLCVNKGHVHENVVNSNDYNVINNSTYASPWLHVETALANNKRIPCLIIYDANLYRDGMFDDAIIKSNENLSSIAYSDDLTCDHGEIEQWKVKVNEHFYKVKENESKE